MLRLTLMYYLDFVAFMENPDKTWNNIIANDDLHEQNIRTIENKNTIRFIIF